MIQKKPTMYPTWRSPFDAHIYEGRVIQVLLMRTAEEPLAEVTVGVSVLAERCKKANGCAEFWVRYTGVVYLHLCMSVCVHFAVVHVRTLQLCMCINLSIHFQVDLQPSGKVMMSVQLFLEDTDTGKTLHAFSLFLCSDFKLCSQSI